MEEALAIIKNAGYGNRDIGRPCLWFDVCITDHMRATLVFFGKDADKIIADSGVHDVKDMDGLPCWVRISGRLGEVKFVRFAKM